MYVIDECDFRELIIVSSPLTVCNMKLIHD